jgi:hypothetical protein
MLNNLIRQSRIAIAGGIILIIGSVGEFFFNKNDIVQSLVLILVFAIGILLLSGGLIFHRVFSKQKQEVKKCGIISGWQFHKIWKGEK